MSQAHEAGVPTRLLFVVPIFIVGFVNHIPKGALLLVSDNPMSPEGVKTSAGDVAVTERYVRTHLEVGIDSLVELRDSGESVKHLRFQ